MNARNKAKAKPASGIQDSSRKGPELQAKARQMAKVPYTNLPAFELSMYLVHACVKQGVRTVQARDLACLSQRFAWSEGCSAKLGPAKPHRWSHGATGSAKAGAALLSAAASIPPGTTPGKPAAAGPAAPAHFATTWTL